MSNLTQFLSAARGDAVAEQDRIKLLPHNKMLYDKIVAEMQKGEYSIFYSEATGLGKSFIFMRLVQDYFVGKKIMYVVPKIAIWKNLTRYEEFKNLNANIDMVTFASFNEYNSALCEKYDAIFVDECHHMLSEIQGNNVNKFCRDMNALNKYSFGFTATPYYKGSYVDEECFDVSCYGYDVCEAIDLGILPKIHFSVANIDIDEIPMDMRARYSITGTKTLLEQLLARNANKHRWIAYFLNKMELEQNEHELKTLFPDYTILKVYDGIENEDGIYDTFNNSTGKVILLSVNKLLEGVHLNNVQGVLLYRNVAEFSTYMQMYGRLCDISAKESPVFLDVANAVFSINRVSEDSIFKSNRCGNRTKRRFRDFFDIHAEDYWTVELMDVIIQASRCNEDKWTEEELNILKEYYQTEGLKVASRLPSKTNSAILGMAARLGIRRRGQHIQWTAEEDDILKTYYPIELLDVCKRLPGRSQPAIKHRAFVLGLKARVGSRTHWTVEEDSILRDNYPTVKQRVKELLPGKSIDAIKTRAVALGLTSEAPDKWTAEEDAILRDNYPTIGYLVKELLPGRSLSGIRQRANLKGIQFHGKNGDGA